LELGIMNPRLATVAPWCREIVLPASVLALLAAFGFAGGGNTGVAPAMSRIAPSLAADAKFADRPQGIAPDRPAAIDDVDFAKTANVLAAKAAAESTPVSPPAVATTSTTSSYMPSPAKPVQVASADPGAPMLEAAPDPAPTSQEAKPIVTAALTDSSEVLPSEQGAKAIAEAPAAADAKPALDTTAVLDECFVIEACVDRYLWALYQRTPKEDTVKEKTQREVTVKRKGKMVTVTRTVTQVVDEDFSWKDPKAADNAVMPLTDYVIGGMDREFKFRLFRMLLAAEKAGLSPGITSAFRDDYRQWIASGLKAANDRSYHGGSSRGGYGHGLAADIVSVNGATRALRQASSETLWNWVDKHGKEFGVGRPYHDHDPPHVGPIDGAEYVSRHAGRSARHARAASRPHLAARAEQSAAQRVRTANAAVR
jgi:hypothetical protein